MAHKGLLFGVDDRPPLGVTLLSALQHVAVIAPVGIVFPLLVLARMGAAPALVTAVLSASLLALGVATILQCSGRLGWGSGFLAPAVFTAAYLPPSLLAAERGGISLVIGMTLFAGLCEMGLSRFLHRLRPFLPNELAGLAVTLIGVMLGMIGFRLLFGLPQSGSGQPGDPALILIGVATLALVVALSVWGQEALRRYAVLIGLTLAYLLAAATGHVDTGRLELGLSHGLVWLPLPTLAWPTFDPSLALDFAIGALASSLRTIGDITTCQKINDPHWVRPDLQSIRRGVFADGAGTALSALLGTVGINTFSASVGLSQATGITSRRVGIAIGGLFILLALFPPVLAVFSTIPFAVTGAILLFSSCFIILNGVQVILSRLLDNRRIITVGLALILALSYDAFTRFYQQLPHWLEPITGSALVVGLVTGMILNSIFRLGVTRKASLSLVPGPGALEEVYQFCERQGGAWGARRDVMQRVTNALVEFAEWLPGAVPAGERACIDLSFDEYTLQATFRWRGSPLEPVRGPVDPEQWEALPTGLSYLIIARLCDRIEQRMEGDERLMVASFIH